MHCQPIQPLTPCCWYPDPRQAFSHCWLCVQVVYQESDSEAEVEVVDAAADLEDDEEGDYYTDDEGEDDDKDEDDSEEDEEDD